jgi:hypothetical protein
MTDEEIYNQIVDIMEKDWIYRYNTYKSLHIPKEHEAAYDIQYCFTLEPDIYFSSPYKYTIYDKDIEKRIYSKNKGISGFLYMHKSHQVLVLKNVKTSKYICIHDATSSADHFFSFKTYLKILDAVRYILSE